MVDLLSSASGLYSGLSVGMTYALIIGIVGAILIAVFYWMFTFPIRVTVYRKRSGKTLKVVDLYCKPIRDRSTKEIMYYKFRSLPFKPVKTMPPPTQESFFVDNRGKERLFVYENENGDFIPMKYNFHEEELTTEERDTKFWYAQMFKETEKVYGDQGIWQKYGSLIAVGIVIIGAFIMLIFILNKMDLIADKLGTVASALGNINIGEASTVPTTTVY